MLPKHLKSERMHDIALVVEGTRATRTSRLQTNSQGYEVHGPWDNSALLPVAHRGSTTVRCRCKKARFRLGSLHLNGLKI